MIYIKPMDKKELLQLVAQPTFKKNNGQLLAGGSDLLVKIEHFGLKTGMIVDVKRIKSLKGITKNDNVIRIGSLTTVTELLESNLLALHAPLLTQSADSFAAVQIRNRSTIGGNICNASPAGDLIPPLYALGAKLKLESAKGIRSVDVDKFFKGPGKTVLKSGEILSEISFSALPSLRSSRFYKLGQRESMAIAIVSLAVIYNSNTDKFNDLRIALGAVAPTVIRAYKAEKILEGNSRSPELIEKAAKIAVSECSPISDVRGSADYRRLMVKRLLAELLN